MTKIILALALLACLNSQSFFALAYVDGCNGAVNESPVLYNEPQLLDTAKNGEKYFLKNGTNWVYIVKVKGSPYEMVPNNSNKKKTLRLLKTILMCRLLP